MKPPLEPSAKTLRSRAGFWVTLLAVLGCFVIFLVVLYVAYIPQRPKAPDVDLAKIPAADRWQYTAKGRLERLEQMRARDEAALTTYGWIDRSKGVVQLPINRAMELTVQRINAARHH